MTLIAAWRCAQGIVLHADSQETVSQWDGTAWTDYRKTVQKIQPQSMGTYQVVIAGSGNAGLILSFIEKLRRRLSGDPSERLTEFVTAFETELGLFYGSDVALCTDKDKDFEFIVSAFSPRTLEYEAWITQNVRLCPLSDFKLSGVEEALYKEVANHFYEPGMTIARAVLAGIYLLLLAEGTSNYVRSPFSIVIVRETGMHMEPDDYVREMAGRLKDYEQRVDQLFLACADTSVSVGDLEALLKEFSETALELHRSHIDSAFLEGTN